MNKPMTLTEQQVKALDQVRHILSANFDAWIICYRTSDENLRSMVLNEWQGDITDVIGLTAVSHDRLLRICNEPRRN